MKLSLNVILLFFIQLMGAQNLSMDLLKNMKPRSIGPGGMSGRVTAIDVVQNQPDIMYVGTASGGVWKSESGGITWQPIFEKEATASIGAIAIQQSNPSVLWVGTGEGNPRNSLNGGFGIYKSIDGGRNWIRMGLENTRHIHRVIIDPQNPNTVYVAAIGSPWGEHTERGVYKTSDGGKTWKNILFTNIKSGAADLVMDPKNPNKLIAAMWQHKREPWFFTSGGDGSGLFITHDGGVNWKKLSTKDGLPEGDLGRIGIAIAKNNPKIIYALIESKKNALYKSENGGFSWKKINDKKGIGNRPFYYSEIYVDPENENRLYSVFTYVNVSEDGGRSFKQLMPAYGVNNGVHPDHHAWWIHPENGKFLIDGNDGGLNISKDGGKTWRFIGNLPVAQFYHINVDNNIPYNVYGGMQDNGSWRGPAYVWRTQGIRNSYWQEISFGDGFDVIPDRDNTRHGWTMSQQGFVSYYDWETGNNFGVRPTHPDKTIRLRFNWNAAINVDPFDSNTVYFGSQFLHKSTNKGLTWDVISGDLTTNNPDKLKQHESGGLTMDATGAENHCSILVIEPAPTEKNVIWIGTDDGQVHITTDGGKSYKNISSNLRGLPKGSWIAQIKASNKNKGEALLIANDYRRFNYEPYAYRTKNYGKSWERIVNKDDVISYTLSIVEDPIESNLLFLGTDDGLYFSINAGLSWKKWTKGFPTVPVKDLVIHPREHDLVIGTFGRAAWVLDDIRPLRALAKNNSILNKKIHLFIPPTAYKAAYQQPTGSRFGADAVFNGTNRASGGRLSYFIKVDTLQNKTTNKNTKTKTNSDSLILNIFDEDRLIRTLKRKTPKTSGIYKWNWQLDEKGVSKPSRSSKKGKLEPSGVAVKPGVYTLKLNYGSETTQNTITVKNDPRLQITKADTDAVYSALKRIETFTKIEANAVKQLVDTKTIAKTFKSELNTLDKKKYENVITMSKDIIEKTENLIALFLGKEDKRQGITKSLNINVNQRIQNAYWQVATRKKGITSTETTLIDHAKTELNKALEKTNQFFNTHYLPYKQKMDSLKLSPFKPIKQFKLE